MLTLLELSLPSGGMILMIRRQEFQVPVVEKILNSQTEFRVFAQPPAEAGVNPRVARNLEDVARLAAQLPDSSHLIHGGVEFQSARQIDIRPQGGLMARTASGRSQAQADGGIGRNVKLNAFER